MERLTIPVESWRNPPTVYPADGFTSDKVKGLFFTGPRYAKHETRHFAWYGAPEGTGPFPAIMLVHGGGGTAFADWVRVWVARGYAAMAVDTCGGVPCWTQTPFYAPNGWPRHAHSSPMGWGVDYDHPDAPPEEQWPYHGVASVILGSSLLASFAEVDAQRIGLTGISWGAVLACIAAGLDARFKCVAPVYGCGFLGRREVGLYREPAPDSPLVQRWLQRWDPAHYLPAAKMPFLWVNGTNDFAFPLPSTMQSAAALADASQFSLPVRMPHGHGGIAERAEEIAVMMDWALRDRRRPPMLGKPEIREGDIFASYSDASPPRSVELAYTRATGFWTDRIWNTAAASFSAGNATLKALLPCDTSAAYLNVTDAEGNLWSTRLVTPAG